jgi:SAM-dependent methyltransferase
MDCSDPLRYWDDRHDKSVGLSGVGCLGLNGYNDWIYRARRRVFRRVLRPYANRLRGARVLDVGSGSGFYLAEWLRHPVGELVGSDFSGVALTRLRRSFPAIPMEPLDIATADRGTIAKLGRFAFISAIDILFHIVNDALYERAFQNLADLLAPSGALIFSENFLQSAPRRRNAWHVLRELVEVDTALTRAGLRIETRAPWLMLMNAPVDSTNALLIHGWSAIEALSRRSRLIGAALGAAMYPAEVLLTRTFRESPTSEIAIAGHSPAGDRRIHPAPMKRDDQR